MDRENSAKPARGRRRPATALLSPGTCGSEPMDLWVVTDTLGGGRVIGAFDSQADAELIANADPNYCRVCPCVLNRATAEALAWAESGQRKALLAALKRKR